MRLFVAIPFNEDMKQVLTSTMNDLHRLGLSGNFSRPENLHLTLAFIGENRDPQAVVRALNLVNSPAFELVTKELGHFGNLVWLGLENDPSLDHLASSVRKNLQESDISFDRKAFRPHITLARRTNIRHLDPQNLPNVPPYHMPVSHFSLMSSERIKGKLIYREIASFSLKL